MVPTAYTEDELAAYQHAILGEVATALGWAVEDGSYSEAVTGALVAYGVSDIVDATDIAKLRACAKREAWALACGSLASRYDFATDQQSFNRSNLHKQALAQLSLAESDLMRISPDSYALVIGSFIYPKDPYAYVPDDLRTLA